MRRLIILGASARAAAFSAVRAGFVPHAIDQFADRDLAAVCGVVKIQRFPDDFLQALAAAPQAPWMYCGGLENHPRLVERLSAVRPLWGNEASVLRRVRSAQRLQSLAATAQCRFPRIGAGDRSLVKPRRSGGGLGIRFATSADAARPPRGHYLQEYIEGEPASAVYVAGGGRAILLGATRQLAGMDFGLARQFLYCGSIGPSKLSPDERESLVRLGHVIAEETQCCGLFNVDFVRAGGCVWLLEVNPRYSASVEVLERVIHVPFVALHADACQTNKLPTKMPPAANSYCGKAVIYTMRDGSVPAELDRLSAEWNANPRKPGLADIPSAGDVIHAGQPVTTVLVDGASLADVEAALRGRIAEVQRVLKACD